MLPASVVIRKTNCLMSVQAAHRPRFLEYTSERAMCGTLCIISAPLVMRQFLLCLLRCAMGPLPAAQSCHRAACCRFEGEAALSCVLAAPSPWCMAWLVVTAHLLLHYSCSVDVPNALWHALGLKTATLD